jgi:outer membrane protein OmpA-like peptidoglycan-associated protein
MSPRRTILYLFLAGCLCTTTSPASPHSLARIPDASTDFCPDPHLPPISFQPGRVTLTRSAKALLRRQTTVIAISCDSCKPDTITVHFDLNRSFLSAEADSILDAYFRNPGSIRQVNIFGYCDYTGSEAYNNRLSMNRAITVRDYLRQHWLDSTTHTDLTGYGTRYPVSDNHTEAGRAENRRVTIVIQRTAIKKSAAPPEPATAAAPQTSTPAQKPDTTSAKKPDTTSAQDPDTPPKPASSPSIYKAITDTATRIGASIILNDVVFYGGRHIPLPFSYNDLEDLAKAMKKNKKLHIRIEGHVCCRPDTTDGPDRDTGEHDLSVQRAKAVYDYLVHRGISQDRMTYIGLGAAGKLYPEELDANQRSANRRVEIRIISK